MVSTVAMFSALALWWEESKRPCELVKLFYSTRWRTDEFRLLTGRFSLFSVIVYVHKLVD